MQVSSDIIPSMNSIHSSGDSNSVTIHLPGSSWVSPISIHDSSQPLPQNNGPLRFEVRLYNDYRQNAVLPELPTNTATTRWITINTEHNRAYKVEMVHDGGGFMLQRGWSILVAIENLQRTQTLMFEEQGEDIFKVWIHRPLHHPPPIGLSPVRIPSADNSFGPTHLVIKSGTQLNDSILHAIQQVWNASSVNGPVYVARLRTNPLEDDHLTFNKVYSYLIPEDDEDVAMRFVGSNIIIPGVMKTQSNRRTRMEKQWSLYAREHNLAMGETFICKIHRGPTNWEFLGFCAGRQ